MEKELNEMIKDLEKNLQQREIQIDFVFYFHLGMSLLNLFLSFILYLRIS